jgi:hypothetical protein
VERLAQMYPESILQQLPSAAVRGQLPTHLPGLEAEAGLLVVAKGQGQVLQQGAHQRGTAKACQG